MTNNFDLLSNIPLLFFAACFFAIFILFLWGGIISLKAKGNPEKVEKGRKILSAAIVSFCVILLAALIFYLVGFLLQRWEASRATRIPGEFPPSSAANFPPAPQFVKLGEYYFTGPWSLKKNNIISDSVVYTILCKKDGEYDIIYIDQTTKAKLLKHEQYRCWLENCNHELKNLYIAIFWASKDKYTATKRKELKEELMSQLNTACSSTE